MTSRKELLMKAALLRWKIDNGQEDPMYAKCITGQIIASDKGEGFGGNFVL